MQGGSGIWTRHVRSNLFFSAFVDGLTSYVIRHHLQIGKYYIIAVPPFPETMHKHRKPIFWAPGRVLHKLDDTRIQINASDRIFTKIISSTCPSCLTTGLFTLQHHAWCQICCLSTKALIQHNKNLTFMSSWCLVSCIFSWFYHKTSHCKPRRGWDFWRSHPGAWISLKVGGRSDLLGDRCGTRYKAEGVACMFISDAHINPGIAIVSLFIALANRWIIKFLPPYWQLLDFDIAAWVRHVDVWVCIWCRIMIGTWGSAR